MMSYDQAIEYLNNRKVFGQKLGLERIEKLMLHLGNPQKQLRFVHIAGTNGKGSTSSFVFHILKEAGLRVGLFTSPYIQRFSERIQVCDEEITQDEIALILSLIKRIVDVWDLDEEPTWFEMLTAMCFVHFRNKFCDIVVLEVGLGGDIDSTNVIDESEVSIITTINYDHMEILGNTLQEIAQKKAGIIKQNGVVVVYPQDKDIIKVIENTANSQAAKMAVVAEADIVPKTHTLQGQTFLYKNIEYNTKMLGTHQVYNASVAIEAVHNLANIDISTEQIQTGLTKTTWPGRMELLSTDPFFLLDGAHNIQGVINLIANIKILFPNKKPIFIVGFLAHKEYKKMIEQTIPLAKSFIAVTPINPKALNATELSDYIISQGATATHATSIDSAIDMAIDIARGEQDTFVCAFGSLYYIGLVRDYFGL